MAAGKKLVIIDGKSVFYRGFYAMPNLATKAGQPTSGVYGFMMLAMRILKEFKPDYVIVAWDKSKTNLRARRKLYEQYKAGRKPMPVELKEQIPILRAVLEAFHWPLIEIDDFEADDIMATLSRQAVKKGLATVLVTSDLDILQAVDGGGVTVCVLKKGLTNTIMYTRERFRQEYGMTPDQFIDYKALKGDASDNVPGVAGVGDKTAKDLVQKYGSLEGVYQHLDEVAPAVNTKLTRDRDMAFLSHKLLLIRFDAPLKLDLKAAAVSAADTAAIAEQFRKLEFRRLIDELPAALKTGVEARPEGTTKPAKAAKVEVVEVSSPDELAALTVADELLVHTLTTLDPDTMLPAPAELVLSITPGQAFIVRGPLLKLLPKDLFKGKQLIGHHLKNDLKAWRWFDPPVVFDTMIAAFVLNSLAAGARLSDLAGDLGIAITPVEGEITSEQAGNLVAAIWKIKAQQEAELKKLPKLAKLAAEVEFPLIAVLAKMEVAGVKLDGNYLVKLAKGIDAKISELTELIHEEAKEDFNISSPTQLATILFTKLGLPTAGVKKGKTGYSTAAVELEKLRGLHPIINLISEYRELTKLKNTYVDVLPKLVDKGSRLHTTFNQTGSQTGRLASDNPNLMNIPVRSDMGKEIRKAFIAEPGHVLVSADYSQFELRLAAVLAHDDNMIHAFNKGIDIHAMTAAEIYDLDDIEMVTNEQRRAAKTVNFGVLYGLSAHGLATGSGLSYEAAQEFIKKYFALRPKLLAYLDSLREGAKKDGYVETLFGRRRIMSDIHSSNWVVRAAAERAAINMPMQGTEADLMKMAMIKVDQKLDADSRMLLQIHDSILVEAPKAKADRVSKLLKETMENIYKLAVKLDVDVKTGTTWGDL